MLDSQLAILENAIARWFNTGQRPQPLGSRHPMVAPFQAFATQDEPIVVCVDTTAQWQRLCDTMARPALIEDPRFADSNDRVRNHAELEPELMRTFVTRTRDEWLVALEVADVPCGSVNAIDQAMALDQGSGQFVAMPIRTRSQEPPVERRAPHLGEHTDQVLGELDYSAADVERLRAIGAV